MLPTWNKQLPELLKQLKAGELIAYPTEAVYGLGCDAFNDAAVQKLIKLKQRPPKKGVIVVASDWAQIASLLAPIPAAILNPILARWPAAETWVFPAKASTSHWLRGEHDSLAVRLSAHPAVQFICQHAGPIVSTSANLAGSPPCRSAEGVRTAFPDLFILEGQLGTLHNPTPIYDALTGKCLRQ